MEEEPSNNPLFNDVMASLTPVVPLVGVQSAGRITELAIGNGLVITEYMMDLLVQARSEVIFTTCFWAESPSLSLLRDALIRLNDQARCHGRRVSVYVMFSSYSFRQKFFSLQGVRKWRSRTWRKLGLPDPATLDFLDLAVLSRFKTPFGVMHAKFMIIDRKVVISPTSNISCMSRNYSSQIRGKLVWACNSNWGRHCSELPWQFLLLFSSKWFTLSRECS